MNNLEATIFEILEKHTGKANALSRDMLVNEVNHRAGELFKVEERNIRDTIKHMVTQHGIWIGSCHRGYYMIETQEELEGACKYYHSYAMSLLFVESRLRKVSLADLLGQLWLDFESQPQPQSDFEREAL